MNKSSLSWSILEDGSNENNSYAEINNQNWDSFSSSEDHTIYESENYKVVNEYSKGQYFGEISCLTKYFPVTWTIRSINNSVCGVIQK